VGDAAGPAREQPVPFSHKHHVEGLGCNASTANTTVENSSYAGIPPTKTCINCHSQIWTNAGCWSRCARAGPPVASIQWIKVHDLPDYVYFNHEIHVNKGIGCASCHGRVDQMPLMYMEKHPADGVWPELPSQPCGEPAADQRDITTWPGGTLHR